MLAARHARLTSILLPWVFIGAALWLGERLRPVEMPGVPVSPYLPSQLPMGAVLLVPWAAWLTLRWGELEVKPVWRVTHALPAVLQTILFAYWSIYWTPVRQHLPAILFQLLFAYAFDALLSLTLQRRWEVGLGPVPIVLSSNLFLQLAPEQLDLSLAIITFAFLSKALIKVKGKHVFNPSAFGITLVGLFWLVAGISPNGDVSSQLNLAPNMAELLLLVGLVVQLRVRTALLTGFAAVGVLLSQRLTGLNHFAPMWPPVLLAITLLATDPATTPTTGPGRALGGFALGFCMPFAGAALASLMGGWDFFGKIVLIPVLNLLAPAFDRLGARLPGKAALEFKYTPAHAALWFFLGAGLVSVDSKMHERERELHQASHTPLIVPNEDGTVSCEKNPIFCRPFTFLSELRGWLE